MNQTDIDIIILSFGKNEHLINLTKQTVSTLYDSEDDKTIKFNPVVLESNKSLAPYQYPGTKTIYPPTKFNFNKYLNIGIKATTANYICFCNNDLIFHTNWASNIIRAMKNDNIDCASTYWEAYHAIERGILPNTGNTRGYRNLFSGWCFLVKRSIFNKTGMFDEKINFWFSDDDFCKTLEKVGIDNHLITNANVTHVGGYSLNNVSEKIKKKLTILPQLYYEYKWHHHSKLKYYAQYIWHMFTYNS
jgi:GT2 family glycosyltransferase